MKIDLIAGARPNFVKIAALHHAIQKFLEDFHIRLIHTGQHYDPHLSETFFQQLKLPPPDINFNVGSGTQAQQTAAIMIEYEKAIQSLEPDVCVVVGDVTSSMACAITAKKMQIKVAHVEAGIRSGDLSMPEEINRLLIDSIADLFFTTTTTASENLINSGKLPGNVHFVGNTMIDTLLRFKADFCPPNLWNDLKLTEKQYFVVTLHRPGNVDEITHLQNFLKEILKNSHGLPVIFPLHPRTAAVLKNTDFQANNLYFTPPLPYLEFNYLIEKSKAVITDSGGITEETTVLGVPCVTLRDNTERPETVTIGTNEIIGTDPRAIAPAMQKVLKGNWKKGKIPELWDGQTANRIIQILRKEYS